MSTRLQDASLRFLGLHEDTSIYGLRAPQLSNRYFILSGPGTRHLMAYPEVVGYDSYLSMLPATVAALRHLFPQGKGGDVDILTILRGGLNYPVEEACFRNGIRVRDIHFVSCERTIEDHIITGLDIKYEKLRVTHDRTLVIGDIIATGDTLRLCLDQVVDRFRRRGGSLRKIIFFTIGGTRAIDLMEEMAVEIRNVFPAFEGFECFFYEGIFTVYEDTGATGINVPDIDFGWKGGIVSPDFRRYVLDHPYSLLEKCIIYDGGARRYEIPVHFHEALEYWEGIWGRADRIDPVKLVGEKLGYDRPLNYGEWLTHNHFRDLMDDGLKKIWADERELLENAAALSLEAIAHQRINAINTILQQYE
ncbi:MAG: hypothetical protein IKN06_02380 [Bacteroidales bacterium]|nr:hypothetical protein [Bacteroidales bacterium]